MSSTFYHPDYTVGIGFVALAQRTELLLNSTYLVPFLISVMILEKRGLTKRLIFRISLDHRRSGIRPTK